MKLYFASNNTNKIKEVVEYLTANNIAIQVYPKKLEELQSESIEEIVKHKALDAYKKIRRPVIVEHTGLRISGFGNLPEGFTQLFWDRLKAEKFCEFFYNKGTVTAISVIGFCNGKTIKTYTGCTEGIIVESPRGDQSFEWDCVFQPNGSDLTFAELGDAKKQFSMRTKALCSLSKDIGAFKL